MNKIVKFLLVLIIIFLISLNYKSLTNQKNTPKNEEDTSTTTPDKSLDENLIYAFEVISTVDSNNDFSFDTLYGDTEITNKDLIDNYGLIVNLEIYDSNDNATLEVGETTHAKFSIKNSSNKDYTIQNINIIGQSSTFNDTDFTNLTTTNAGDLDYKFENLSLTYPQDKGFILSSGIEASFEFDILWSDDEELNNINKLINYKVAAPFIGIDFIATSKDTSLYIEIRNEQLNFSGKKL